MSAEPVAEAAALAREGRLIVFPTDTLYGLATRPDDATATARLFDAKRRPSELTLPVLCSSTAEARTVATFDARADRLAAWSWPGALTIVLARTERSRSWELGGDPDTIGVRVPAHPLALAVLAASGPLAVTSANRSGEPPARTCAELEAAFGDLVDLFLCDDEPLEGLASTVVDLTHGDAVILRVGDVSPEVVARLITGEDPLLDSGPPS